MKISFTIVILFFAFYASSQKCATVNYLQQNASKLSQPRTIPLTISGERDTLSNEVIVVPVVVHVLYNNAAQNISDAQVLSQIEVLNQD